MFEKVLLCANEGFHQKAVPVLKRFGVDMVDAFHRDHHIPFGELSARYSVVVIETTFCGNSRNTAALVRKMRQEFLDPIISLEIVSTGEGSLPLRVAGCNFTVPEQVLFYTSHIPRVDLPGVSDAGWEERLLTELCQVLGRVCSELSRDHHRMAA